MEDHKFIYNIAPLLQERVVVNAYDVVKELPGVMELSGTLSLAGSDNLKIVIDGQVSSLSLKQISRILKSTPSSRVENIEVAYNAPAKYNTNGAVINVILKSEGNKEEPFTGELGTNINQSFYPSASQNLSLSYNKDKLRIDFLGNFNVGKYWSRSAVYTQQVIADNTSEITEQLKNTSKYYGFSPRIGLNYKLAKDKTLTFSYYLDANKSDSYNYADALFKEQTEYQTRSKNKSDETSYLNNVYLAYSSKAINVGADLVFFNDDADKNFQSQRNNSETQMSINKSKQNISKYSVFFNHNILFANKLKLSYGTNAGYNNSDTKVNYYNAQNEVDNQYDPVKANQTEYQINGYVEASYRFNPKLYVSSSMKVEYFNSSYTNNDVETTLWNGWSAYPKATLTYTINKDNNLQFSLTSSKRFPSYWAINPETTNLSSYVQIQGNPHLKPSTTYRGRLHYTFRRKYMLSVSYRQTSNFFMQLPHMSEDQLKIIHRYENYDKFNSIDAMLVVPFKLGRVLNSRLTLQGARTHEAINAFYGSSINNIYFDYSIRLTNAFRISPKFLFQVNGGYMSPTRQGAYALGSRWDLDSSIQWSMNSSVSLIVNYNNILKHQMPRPMEIDYSNQYSWSRNYEVSSVGISILWNFNKYKSKRYNTPDYDRLN